MYIRNNIKIVLSIWIQIIISFVRFEMLSCSSSVQETGPVLWTYLEQIGGADSKGIPPLWSTFPAPARGPVRQHSQ